MLIQDFKKTAVVYGDNRISYAELIERVRDYSALLGVKKGERAAIFFENRPEWIYTFYAGWNVGATDVLIDMMSTKGEVDFILRDCQPHVIVTSNRNKEIIDALLPELPYKPRVINVDEVGAYRRDHDVEEYMFEKDDIALLLYTSGTTGTSKGVMLSYWNVMVNVRWNNDSGRININDVLLAVLPTHHSWPLMATVLCPLDCGATIVQMQKLTGDEITRLMKENKVTMLTAVPRLFEMIHKSIRAKINASLIARALLAVTKALDIMPLSKAIFGKVHREFGGNIKTFISGGAALDPSIIKDYRGMGILMLEGYGLTETAPMITYHPFDAQKIGTVGRVFDEIDIRFEEDGEIVVKGPNVMKGYWNRPEETAAVLKDGWYSTGDLGVMDSKRYLTLTGRKKELIILGNGKNVRPDLIEQKIKESFPLVEDIAVSHRDGHLVAIIKPDMAEAKRQGVSNLIETLKWKVIDLYNQKVENYKKIHDIVVTNDDIPRTRMGKVKRYLLAPFLEGNQQQKKKEEIPSFEEYAIVAELVEETSGKIPNPSDHLELDLGMDSLSLVELQLGLEKSFGMTFAEGELASFPSVKELAEAVRAKKTTISREEMNWKVILSGGEDIELPKGIWMMKLLQNAFFLCFGRRVKLVVTGAERIPAGACIIAPNHQSFMDVILLNARLKNSMLSDMFFFAKEKNFDFALGRFFAKRAHVIIMDLNRNITDSLRMIAAVLRRGKKIVIFPEGARSRDGKLQPFKKSFAIMSKELGVPVVPVVIKGAYDLLPIGKKIPSKGTIIVEFLAPIDPAGLDEQQISEAARKAIEEKLK